MLLSTSSSNSKIGTWWNSLLVAVLIFVVSVTVFEFYLSKEGYKPWVSDSAALWGSQRERVNWVDKPIVLVGASRIQLDTDVDELQQLTGRSVVQLAIDGQHSVPVLENLASEDSFNGTVIVALQESAFTKRYEPSGTVLEWIQNYEERHRGTISPNLEAMLQAKFQLLSYYHSIEMDKTELFERLINGVPASIYLKTTDKRDRYADYRMVRQPDFYVNRVFRHLGYIPDNFTPKTMKEFSQMMLLEINSLGPGSSRYLDDNIARIVELSNRIEKMGGTAVFIRMPTDKLVYAIDQRRFPKDRIWGKVSSSSVRTLHFSDIKGIEGLNLPDGSHMDQHQKIHFTRLLFSELKRRYWL